MSTAQLLELLMLMDEVFPLPKEKPKFKGRHMIVRDGPDVKLRLWYWHPKRQNIFCRQVTFTEDESIDKAALEAVKRDIQRTIA